MWSKSLYYWEYFDKILNLKLENDNLTYYNLYGLDIKKPTCFKSNIKLNLLNDNSVESVVKFKHYSKDYNVRSHIPLALVKNIFEEVGNYLNDNKSKWLIFDKINKKTKNPFYFSKMDFFKLNK